MNGDDNLGSALRALAAETSRTEASSSVRDSLRAELKARARRRYVAAWWPAAAAALLVLGLWLGMPRTPAPPPIETAVRESTPAVPVEEPVKSAVEAPESAAEPAARSLPRVRTAAMTAEPAVHRMRAVTPWYFYSGLPLVGSGQVVRVEVSAATAAQFGVYAGPGLVPAQVFIGDDGLARAIRFVR